MSDIDHICSVEGDILVCPADDIVSEANVDWPWQGVPVFDAKLT